MSAQRRRLSWKSSSADYRRGGTDLFLPMKSPFAARIDTGATTSSLDCQDVEYFERDGENGLRLNLKTVRQARNMFLKRKSNVHLRLSVPEKTKAAKPLKWMLRWAEKCSAPYFP